MGAKKRAALVARLTPSDRDLVLRMRSSRLTYLTEPKLASLAQRLPLN